MQRVCQLGYSFLVKLHTESKRINSQRSSLKEIFIGCAIRWSQVIPEERWDHEERPDVGTVKDE